MRLLLIDDEANLRRMLRLVLEDEGYHVTEAGSAEEGLRLAPDASPEVVLLDLALPGISGLEALPRLQALLPGTPIVMMSGEASLSDAVRATRQGAFHFLEKPLSPEAVIATLRGAMEVSRARELSRALREEIAPGTRLVGQSAEMERVRELLRKVAPTQARVLITGESGTGKELAAAAIHALSDREGGPFVRVNSAAIPRELVESEMFGHEKGAFTGATERRRGRFELANGGTLFLDEVGDLGSEAQAKLLRALESGGIQRVGGQDSFQVDVRVIAATNRDLRTEVTEGRFREDLLFRLEVVVVPMPALRDRIEDLPELIDHAAALLRRRQGLTPPDLSDDALTVLREHPWPGNVRELLNVIERMAILHPGGRIDGPAARSLLGRSPDAGAPPLPGAGSLRDRLDAFEREAIETALRAGEGVVAEAARLLETDRGNLYRRMKRLGISEG